jgi:hypothetical protein
MRFTLENTHEHPLLRNATVGQTITIHALITSSESDAVEITTLGDPQPKFVLGSSRLNLIAQEITT